MTEPSEDAKRRGIAVWNERLKLLANALDRMSTACLAIGVLGPTVGVFYGTTAMNLGPRGLFLLLSHVVWMSAAGVLHLLAQRALGRLR